MENRSDLIVDACLTTVCSHSERLAALTMIEPHANRPKPITLGADRGYDADDFIRSCVRRSVRAVAQNLTRSGSHFERPHSGPSARAGVAAPGALAFHVLPPRSKATWGVEWGMVGLNPTPSHWNERIILGNLAERQPAIVVFVAVHGDLLSIGFY